MCVCFFKGSYGAVFLKLSIGHIHQNPVGHRFLGSTLELLGQNLQGYSPQTQVAH